MPRTKQPLTGTAQRLTIMVDAVTVAAIDAAADRYHEGRRSGVLRQAIALWTADQERGKVLAPKRKARATKNAKAQQPQS